MPNWYSSYEQNNYGELFYSLMRIHQPQIVVELGTLTGYSAYHIARGLRDNNFGKLDCYDLWEKYIGHLGSSKISRASTEKNLKGFSDIINLNQENAIGIEKRYDQIDILHIDLDNDAQILEQVVPAWIAKVKKLIIIEGGSEQRDELASETNSKRLSMPTWLKDLNVDMANTDDELSQFVKVEGQEKYKEKPIVPWLEQFSKNRNDIQYLTFEPFPSLTIIKKANE